MLLPLVLNPSWVWPDPARVRLYPYAVALNTLMIVAALLLAVRGQGTTLAWCAYAVPVVAWIGTFMLLRVRPTGSPEAIHSWYYPGDNTGWQFVYRSRLDAQTD